MFATILFVGGTIKAPCDNEVWQLILQLREIVELICAPVITEGQVAYLKVITEEYICNRKRLFLNDPLRTKHHYLGHYPDLIIHFGPLACGLCGLKANILFSNSVPENCAISKICAKLYQRDTNFSRPT